MRASTCNEALCCALRSALCLGQPLARGVDVQLMRRSALQRLASESLRVGFKAVRGLRTACSLTDSWGLGRMLRLAACVTAPRLRAQGFLCGMRLLGMPSVLQAASQSERVC